MPPQSTDNEPSQASHSPVEFPPELPISARVLDIARAIDAHQVVIVEGETGSGKTTQLPKLALAMGRGVERMIGVTQPRRIAATSVAARVASELKVTLGQEVGYQIRFTDHTTRSTYVKFMTDGILLAELAGDPLLSRYDTLIIDEAHERSLNIDFLLGIVRRILPRRPDLRVIVSSATLETERFARFFDGAPIISVSGRTYPVDVLYRPPTDDEADVAELVANAVSEVADLDARGDILVFLPGEREIRDAQAELEGRRLKHTVVMPLYGRLSNADQARVFSSITQRKVILATNVAETSLTIPGIVYVVDAGLARINRYVPRTGVTTLLVERVSRASADQRKGRAGRTQHGMCVRLYDEKDYQDRQAYTDPELLRSGLSGVILRMKAQNIGDIEKFPFLDPPSKRAIDEGYRVLEELGALDDKRELTDVGRKLARFPTDPRIARMILGGQDRGALTEVLVIAAALSVQDPRERPLDKQQKADEAHRRFADEGSDFVGFLKLWQFIDEARKKSMATLRRVCRDSFLSFLRVREWLDVHEQLTQIVRELGLTPNSAPADAEALHRALLPGLLSRIGMLHTEQQVYIGARQTRFAIHPSSRLARKKPAWVMAAELVETSQLFARCVAKIDPSWLEEAAGPLCKRTHGDPHWEQKPAEVRAHEQVSLFGLPIIKQRSVHFGPVDPVVSRKLFILHALARHEYASNAPFFAHNQRVLAEAARLRDKARRADMIADDVQLCMFFEEKVPDGIYSGKTFEQWRGKAEGRDPKALELTLADVLEGDAEGLSQERYPDSLDLYGTSLALTYRFDPSEDDDGASVEVPLVLLPQLDPAVLEHTIPGWHERKIELLLDALPRAHRKGLGQPSALAARIAPRIRPFDGPLLSALEDEVQADTGQVIPRDAWRLDELPPFLRFYFRVVDHDGKVLGEGRDLSQLKARLADRAARAWLSVQPGRYDRDALTSWDFDELPASIETRAGAQTLLAYPALVDQQNAVGLRLLESPDAARKATREGLRRLYLLGLRASIDRLESQLPQSLNLGALGAHVGMSTPVRRQLVLRALSDAFDLDDPSRTPRTRAAFAERLEQGRRKLPAMLTERGKLASEIGAELEKVASQIKSIKAAPGSKHPTLDDVRSQLTHLAPPDLFLRESEARLRHVPRYLRGIQTRLARLPNDPRKDIEKAASVQPLWQRFVTKRDDLRARQQENDRLDAFGWMLEELRISVFAPELKTPVPVSAQRLEEAWAQVLREG